MSARNVTREQVVRLARTWLGTPFHHQGRVRGVGVDCVGLVIGVARELGLVPDGFDVTGYVRQPDGTSFTRLAGAHMRRIESWDMQPGDVVAVTFDHHPQHMGILGAYLHGGLSIIHAASAHGKVVETRLLLGGGMRFDAAYALPGVT